MSNYLRDLIRVVLLSNDILQTDIQRIQLLQKVKIKLEYFLIEIPFFFSVQSGNEQSPFNDLVKRLIESNEQMKIQATKVLNTKNPCFYLCIYYFVQINRLVPEDDDKNRSLILDSNTISSIELSIRNLDRLAKTFQEICSGLTIQLHMLSGKIFILYHILKSYVYCLDTNERISIQDIENIAYQACDKIYKKEDNGPYENLW